MLTRNISMAARPRNWRGGLPIPGDRRMLRDWSMGARQLHPPEVDDLVVLYGELGNVADAARQFGVTRQTVGMHLAARGIETVRRMSVAGITTATEFYREGGLRRHHRTQVRMRPADRAQRAP